MYRPRKHLVLAIRWHQNWQVIFCRLMGQFWRSKWDICQLHPFYWRNQAFIPSSSLVIRKNKKRKTEARDSQCMIDSNRASDRRLHAEACRRTIRTIERRLQKRNTKSKEEKKAIPLPKTTSPVSNVCLALLIIPITVYMPVSMVVSPRRLLNASFSAFK